MNLNDYQPAASRKVLIYGAPKTGKTALAGQVATIKKLHWCDGEDAVKTLMNRAILAPEFRSNINYIRLPDTQTHPIMFETVLRIVKGEATNICYNHGVNNCPKCKADPAARWSQVDVRKFGPDDVLVIDSVSQLAASAMHRVIAPKIVQDFGNYKPDWDDYRSQGFLLDRLFTLIQAAPFSIICISHEQLVEMEDKRMKLVPIGGTSNFSKTFAKYFDDVVYCDKVNNKHVAFSSSTYSNSIITGSRAGVLIEKDPNGILSLFQ